ncbi:MAG: hypothetical protein ACFFC7_34790 [Candidatus Hermodarchaeota archaeon]
MSLTRFNKAIFFMTISALSLIIITGTTAGSAASPIYHDGDYHFWGRETYDLSSQSGGYPLVGVTVRTINLDHSGATTSQSPTFRPIVEVTMNPNSYYYIDRLVVKWRVKCTTTNNWVDYTDVRADSDDIFGPKPDASSQIEAEYLIDLMGIVLALLGFPYDLTDVAEILKELSPGDAGGTSLYTEEIANEYYGMQYNVPLQPGGCPDFGAEMTEMALMADLIVNLFNLDYDADYRFELVWELTAGKWKLGWQPPVWVQILDTRNAWTRTNTYTRYFRYDHPSGGGGGGGGGGGCPNLLVWTGEEYYDEGIIDIHTEGDPHPEMDKEIYRELFSTPAMTNHVVDLRLMEYGDGYNFTHSLIDSIALYAVMDNGDTRRLSLIQAIHSSGDNVRRELRRSDDVKAEIIKGEYIDLRFVLRGRTSRVRGFIFFIEAINPMKQ